MNIFIAAHYLRSGNKISRKAWDTKTYLIFDVSSIIKYQIDGHKYFTIENGKATEHVSDWEIEFEPSIEDLLAEDYYIYERITT